MNSSISCEGTVSDACRHSALRHGAKRRSVQASNLSLRRNQRSLVGRNPSVLKNWADCVHDVPGKRSNRGIRQLHVFADVRDTRAQERVLQFFNCQRQLCGTGFRG